MQVFMGYDSYLIGLFPDAVALISVFLRLLLIFDHCNTHGSECVATVNAKIHLPLMDDTVDLEKKVGFIVFSSHNITYSWIS